MSWAMRKFSRVRLSRNAPWSASRGAKPMEWIRMSSPSQRLPRLSNSFSTSRSLPTSHGSTMSVPSCAAQRLGDAPRDRAVAEDAGDECALAFEETHVRLLQSESSRRLYAEWKVARFASRKSHLRRCKELIEAAGPLWRFTLYPLQGAQRLTYPLTRSSWPARTSLSCRWFQRFRSFTLTW